MDPQTAAQIVHTLQTTAIAAVIFAACVLLPRLQAKAQLEKLPSANLDAGEKARQAFITSARKLYQDGYHNFKNSVFRLINENGQENVIVPRSLLQELRKMPDDVLSFPKAIEDDMEIKYTRLQSEGATAIHVVKSDLTSALPRLNPIICQDVDAALKEYMPPCDDWTDVNINAKLVTIIAKVSGRIFVGPELSRDPEYLDAACNYTIDLINAVNGIKKIRPWLKPFLAPRTPELIALRNREKQAEKILQPLVAERLAAKAGDPNWQEPDDMLQWMINRSDGKESVALLARYQLAVIFAAIHTTTMTATNVLYTLAVTPEYIEPIREEIRNAIAEHGSITFRALQQMVKLDSYMKEVTRLYPPGITSFARRTLKGITLSNGQYIPPGVTIEVPSAAIYTDESVFPSSETFDGLRAYNARSTGKASDIARNQFVTTNEENLTFGYGRHACPGRFFAANEIKMVVARLVLDYDVKMPNDETKRYTQIEIGKQSMPDPTKTLAFKKVVI
ncbi:hypothetical protein COCMIDRAFT_87809 [Bipolaris oryzae ATCC 44560]|uniref:Cytochrome P450 monooxygenase n=1 Tax=Bipolaris oryzae ATCC 44560 TaxID=930090 RepID=W6ZWQ5_COCMI|nr:uncharacterized protein COCMIDRAFT_87809 [Bipolaris oryzae ATCC 44560]EUC48236.1 hypothetical protein COCMIDRAFT_87809 [Bipolaris oryzae ATCC 44560]